VNLLKHPLKIDDIVSWYQSKKDSLEGSGICLVSIRRGEHGPKPAAVADFDGVTAIGQISGWVSGEFDFHALRTSDGKDIYWRHVVVTAVQNLETVFSEFLDTLQSASSDG
jgi:hypothetical protein